jgi:hypothetical protein
VAIRALGTALQNPAADSFSACWQPRHGRNEHRPWCARLEFAVGAGHNVELTRIRRDKGRAPFRKILGADTELKTIAWCHVLKLERPVPGCHDRRRFVVLNFSKDHRRVRDHTSVDISDGANDGCGVTCPSESTPGREGVRQQVRHRHRRIGVSVAASLAKERQPDEQHMRIQSRVLICEVCV